MEKENSIVHFIKYNNTIPIVLGILFLSTTATMAASPAVRDSVYSSSTTTKSVDNTYLISVDLERYPFAMRVTKVTEDDEYFYLSYDFDTVDVADGVWRDVVRKQELRVSKALLGGGNFEAYVESELSQVKSLEFEKLSAAQKIAQKAGASQKIVATSYSGLVGKFIDPSEEHIPQYVSEISTDDPLRLKNPQPLVTWDQNAEPEEQDPEIPPSDNNDGGGDTQNPPDEPATDYCPTMDGIQDDPNTPCETTGGGGGGSEEPPQEDPAPEPSNDAPPASDAGGGTSDGASDGGGETGGE